jgi:hypothetical protein
VAGNAVFNQPDYKAAIDAIKSAGIAGASSARQA